ncbi:MAG: hypothetical protein NT178_05990 [Proteobacteria bacterium]|nr:hypothetical protein [Pseudomonadota bacterium]
MSEAGENPEGTINYLVAKRLMEISEALEKKKDKDKEGEVIASKGGNDHLEEGQK